MPDPRMRPAFLVAISIVVLALLVSLFGLTSLNLPFIRPSGSAATILLFALSTFIFLGLVIFGFILFRSLLKLRTERRANVLGSKFKTRMVYGALGLSVLPVCFLFLFSYSLLNRTLDKWFSRPFERLSQDAHQVVAEIQALAQNKVASDAQFVALELETKGKTLRGALAYLQEEFPSSPPRDMDYLAVLSGQDKLLLERRRQADWPAQPLSFASPETFRTERPSSLLVGLESNSYAFGWASLQLASRESALVVVGKRLPPSVSEAASRLHAESMLYGELSRERKTLRQTYLSILLLLTVMILFIATWFALFLSRQVTVPIQALAEATHEVSRGNLEFRVKTKAADELGILVRSFNEMTQQLAAGRAALEQSRSHLERVNLELDRRSRLTEAILESIPTGVFSVFPNGDIRGANSAAQRLFGRDLPPGTNLSQLFSGDDMRELIYLMKRAARLGQVTRHLEAKFSGKPLNLAITVSALAGSPPGSPPGQAGSGWFVIVMEDLSDLLQAQKAAAWGEVAQRVAHEIKNPLTPIALSAERISLWLSRREKNGEDPPEFRRVIQESCLLIRQEVEQLQRLVDEFSQFARFPKAQPVPANLNQIAESALGAFNGRLDGICVRTKLADDLPPIPLDADQFRRVFINLIDNAAAAMESSLVKELLLVTRADSRREVVEAEVCDTGCGVSPEDKEKLFLPYFSTKDHGTGLGLAIVNRIITEHNGSIRVEENRPMGTRFVIELPMAGNG
ncbi:MAG: HAMP domain-containing protein [Acidobacteria bacterium]|nr:HAMP domain-containing protein [Acidobacteriota bacterium]